MVIINQTIHSIILWKFFSLSKWKEWNGINAFQFSIVYKEIIYSSTQKCYNLKRSKPFKYLSIFLKALQITKVKIVSKILLNKEKFCLPFLLWNIVCGSNFGWFIMKRPYRVWEQRYILKIIYACHGQKCTNNSIPLKAKFQFWIFSEEFLTLPERSSY